MTHTVQLLPSGHTFDAEPGETLLEAALRSGMNLKYSCKSGSCGECQARLVSGKLGRMGHHDYVFSEREKAAGHILLCAAHAAGDLVIEAVEAQSTADIPHQSITTTVSKLRPLSDTVMEVNLRTPRSQTLWFLAGQYVCVRIGDRVARNKSVASCPCNGMVLQFHVKRVAGDAFADYVYNDLRPRDKVVIEGPYGEFVLDEDSPRPSIFLAYETGFAPIKSLIEHAISLEFNQPLRLYWMVPEMQDLYMANYCRSWQDALDDFRFIPVVGAGGNPDWQPPDEQCRAVAPSLTPAARRLLHAGCRVVADHPDLSGFDVYVNGPEEELVEMTALLRRHGLPEDRLFVDRIRHLD